MAIDPSISLQGVPSQINFGQQVAQSLTLGNLLQQKKANQQALDENDLKLQQMRDDAKANQMVQDILAKTPDIRKALPQIFQTVGQRGVQMVKPILDLEQSIKQMDVRTAADAWSAMSKFNDAIDEIFAYPPEQRNAAYLAKISQLEQTGNLPTEMKDGLPTQWDDELMGFYGNQMKRDQEKLARRKAELEDAMGPARQAKAEADARAAQAAAQSAEQTAAGTQPIQPYQQKQLDARPPTQIEIEQRAARGDKEAQTILDAQVKRRKAGTAAGAGSGLTPEGLDVAANQYAYTGVMPTLGMGASGERIAILNRAGELYPGLLIAQSKAGFDANRASLVQLQRSTDAILAFERTTQKNMNLLIETAGSIPDTGSPWLNKPIRAIAEGALGNKDIPAFRAAKMVDLTELSKIITNPNLTGVLTNEARNEVTSLAPDTVTVKQLLSVAKVLRRDMANRKESMLQQIEAVKRRIGNMLTDPYGSGETPEKKTVKMRAPNGQVSDVPSDQVEHFKSLGAVVVK